jgi:hypothetical protein
MSAIVPSSQAELNAPSAIVPSSEVELVAPSAITPNAIDPENPPFSLRHARILYSSSIASAPVISTTGSNPAYTLIPNTAQRWTYSANGNLIYTITASVNVDTICIGAHSISKGGYTVTPYYRVSLGSALQLFAVGKSPSNDNAIMFHRSSSVSATVIEIHLTAGSGAGFIGSVYAGIALQMQRPFFGGHTPAVLARQADYYSSMSESGNFIGVEVRRRAIESSADWKNITDTWYRQYVVPFLASAETLPFYFAWNLEQYPTDVVYCKNITNIAPSYSGQRNLMTFSIPLVGIA